MARFPSYLFTGQAVSWETKHGFITISQKQCVNGPDETIEKSAGKVKALMSWDCKSIMLTHLKEMMINTALDGVNIYTFANYYIKMPVYSQEGCSNLH
jgi:hypothetical protein